MKTGIIFDIQRFALHDGPGIRTTVFLKGCPLSCLWCHNPESIDPSPQLSYDEEKCVRCGACAKVCPSGVHEVSAEHHTVYFNRCIQNGACVTACLYGALKIVGKTMSPDAIMDEVVKDIEYYRQSGGGLTLSGGEPMQQFEFAKELLTKAKTAGISTCLDTCGFAPTERYFDMLPLVDLFLYDYKATNPERHKELTGVDNGLILRNLSVLHEHGASIILRCPLVRGVNDTDDHLAGIAALANKYTDMKIEIMAYHNMARDKAKRVGRTAITESLETTTDECKQQWLTRLRGLGCEILPFAGH